MLYDLHLFEVSSVLCECLLEDCFHRLTSLDRYSCGICASKDDDALVNAKSTRTLRWTQVVRNLRWLLPFLLFHVVEYLDHLKPDYT